MLPTTVERVPNHTSDSVNERIRCDTEERVAELREAGPAAIEQRLAELDEEWDIERTLEAHAAGAMLVGLGLGATVDRRWFAFPAVVGAFLLQHALHGWCPSLPVRIKSILLDVCGILYSIATPVSPGTLELCSTLFMYSIEFDHEEISLRLVE